MTVRFPQITDAAGKWKKYESNGMGELVKVIEPNPDGGADLETLYAYNNRGQMTTATMTRGGATQVRTFVYDAATGRLTSVTKPETGTTTYSYNVDGTVQHAIDAKNQKTAFTYDALKRVTKVKRFLNASGAWVERKKGRVTTFTFSENFPAVEALNPCTARTKRVVAVGCPHHLTQRGNYRQDVFFSVSVRATAFLRAGLNADVLEQ